MEVLMLVIHSYDIFTFTMNKTAFISLYTVVEVNVVEVREVFALSPTLYSVYMKELIKDKSPLWKDAEKDVNGSEMTSVKTRKLLNN